MKHLLITLTAVSTTVLPIVAAQGCDDLSAKPSNGNGDNNTTPVTSEPNPQPAPNQHQINTKSTPNQHQINTKSTPNQHQINTKSTPNQHRSQELNQEHKIKKLLNLMRIYHILKSQMVIIYLN
ncbi:hypothetical protein SAM46_01635 [Mycoplasmopsis verecunda]|uniref:hypothetical protein n=1 Tax=Mycoplasmopsis verecunda TaxID=171291 RepID=UPI00298C1685|nr:hypothetical protein [Mycoplasmopsis verecunda]WPB54838.1 hypothetical protein SAM46_01635 [Mycoplasmopsis verecunda]